MTDNSGQDNLRGYGGEFDGYEGNRALTLRRSQKICSICTLHQVSDTICSILCVVNDMFNVICQVMLCVAFYSNFVKALHRSNMSHLVY